MFATKNFLLSACIVLPIFLGLPSRAAADLLGYYTFEETTGGTLVDSSGRARHAVITPKPTKNAPRVSVSSRFGLDGGAGHARVVDGARLFDIAGADKPFTIAMWFQAPSFGAAERNHLIQFGGGSGRLFRITTTSDKTTSETTTRASRISVDNGRRTTSFDADNAGSGFLSNTWYHLAVIYNGSDTLALYIDGVFLTPVRGQVAPWTTTPSATDFYICTRPNRDDSDFNGIVRDLGIWNEVLSSEKIALINGLGRFSGVGLNDVSISNVSRVFGAKTGTAAAGDHTWAYQAALGSNTLGATGGSVAGGTAYVVLDHSGNGVRIVIPEPPTTRLLTPAPDAGARRIP